jgi:hypothetical protein
MDTRRIITHDLAILRNALSVIPPSADDIAAGARQSLDRIELVIATYFRMTEIIEAAKHSAFADRYASSSTKMNPLDYHINAGNPVEGIDDTRDDPTYASNLDLESAVDDTGHDEEDQVAHASQNMHCTGDEAEPSVECAYGDPDLEPSPDCCFCCGTIFSDEDRSHLMVDSQDFKCPNPRCSSNPA